MDCWCTQSSSSHPICLVCLRFCVSLCSVEDWLVEIFFLKVTIAAMQQFQPRSSTMTFHSQLPLTFTGLYQPDCTLGTCPAACPQYAVVAHPWLLGEDWKNWPCWKVFWQHMESAQCRSEFICITVLQDATSSSVECFYMFGVERVDCIRGIIFMYIYFHHAQVYTGLHLSYPDRPPGPKYYSWVPRKGKAITMFTIEDFESLRSDWVRLGQSYFCPAGKRKIRLDYWVLYVYSASSDFSAWRWRLSWNFMEFQCVGSSDVR